MERILFLVFALVIAINFVSCAGLSTPPTNTNSTSQATNATTQATTTTTQATTTTTQATTTTTQATTTQAPNTTTQAPNTTTQAPSTTTQAPSTTTQAPNITTHSPATTTTPAPTPAPKQGSWNVTGDNKDKCIVMKAALQIQYKTRKVNVPPSAKAHGNCADNMTQNIILTWPSTLNDTDNIVEVVFFKNASAKTVSIKEIFVSVVLPTADSIDRALTEVAMNFSTTHPDAPSVKVNQSYKCNSHETVELSQNATLEVMNAQYQAFHSGNNTNFDTASECEADKKASSDIVPIAVGCALAALVVIILIAYLVGRRRSRQKGYQSV